MSEIMGNYATAAYARLMKLSRSVFFRFVQPALGALLCAHLMSGCVAVAVGAAGGAATYAVVTGTLSKVVDADVIQVYDATTAAMKKLEFPIQESTKDGVYAKVLAQNAQGDSVRVVVETTKQGTQIKIRVGNFGNEAVSRKILSEIEKGLAKSSQG